MAQGCQQLSKLQIKPGIPTTWGLTCLCDAAAVAASTAQQPLLFSSAVCRTAAELPQRPIAKTTDKFTTLSQALHAVGLLVA